MLRAALLTLLVLGGCYTGNPDGDQLAVVGDSVTDSARTNLENRLEPDRPLHVLAQGGITIKEARPLLQLLLDEDPPDTAVVELGANDLVEDVSLDVLDQRVANLLTDLRQAGVRCIFWMKVPAETAYWPGPRGSGFNQRVAQRTEVLEWHHYSKDHPDWFGADGLHLTDLGKRQFAKYVEDQLAAREGACPNA